MRDFFIRGFEAVVGVILAVAALGIVVAAGAAAFGSANVEGMPVSGPLAGLVILVGGAVGLLVYGGLLYLGLGIYHNTRRAAEALDRMDRLK